MFPLRQLNHWNALVVPPVGFVLNFVFIWLVLRRTPKEMRVHSRILLQTCLLDILFLCLITIGSALVIDDGTLLVLVYDGYLVQVLVSAFGLRCLFIHYHIFLFFYFFDSFSVSAQFVYRYLVLNRNVKVRLSHYLLLLSVPFCVCLFLVTIFACTQPKPSIVDKQSVSLLRSMDMAPSTAAAVVEKEQFVAWEDKFSSYSMLIFPCYAFFYTIAGFCAWRMVRFVNAQASVNSEQLRELNRQLTRNLIILASIALMPCALNVAIYLLSAINVSSPEDSLPLIFLVNAMGYWLPLLNPVASILTNRPYRQAVGNGFLLLCCRKKNMATVGVIVAVAPALRAD